MISKRALKLSSLLIAATTMAACNSVPVGTLTDTFSINVRVSEENSKPIAVDFLWVIDDSASMCQEQASLAASFNEFITRITSFVNIDYRIAVVTTNMLSEDKLARFRHHKTTKFPFACTQSRVTACLENPAQVAEASQELKDLCVDGQCSCNHLGSSWVCDSQQPDNVLNCNVADGERTVNSACKLTCTSDADCDTGLVNAEQGAACAGDESQCVYKCLNPSQDLKDSGCVLRPETDACPESNDLRQVLIDGAGTVCSNGNTPVNGACDDGSTPDKPSFPYLTPNTAADYFKCVGVVGADQHNDANLEQGLNAAIWALHPGGPNSDQAKTFLRDDAYLVVVFVSDEDDCSTADCSPDDEGQWKCGHRLPKERYGTCTCLKDATEGGELRPVSEAVNLIKSLKTDPGRVLVAAIVGDSQATEQSIIDGERSEYMNSKCNSSPNPEFKCTEQEYKHPYLYYTYICNSDAGKADLGKRYIEFVRAFGANGILTNICSDAGVGPALSQIADRIIRVFTKVCLPRRVGDEQSLAVKLVGPTGKCTDGSACCTVQSSECSADVTCGDGSQCVADEVPIEYGEEPDTQTWRFETTTDCPAEADSKAIVFNSLLAPGTDLVIDYQAATSLQVSQ